MGEGGTAVACYGMDAINVACILAPLCRVWVGSTKASNHKVSLYLLIYQNNQHVHIPAGGGQDLLPNALPHHSKSTIVCGQENLKGPIKIRLLSCAASN